MKLDSLKDHTVPTFEVALGLFVALEGTEIILSEPTIPRVIAGTTLYALGIRPTIDMVLNGNQK